MRGFGKAARHDGAMMRQSWPQPEISPLPGGVANSAEHRHQRSWADLCVLQGQPIPVVPVKMNFERSEVAGGKPVSAAHFPKRAAQAAWHYRAMMPS